MTFSMSDGGLKIHEFTKPSGELGGVFLRSDGANVVLVDDEGELALPSGAVAAVMQRFGGPLEASERVVDVGALTLDDGASLRHVRHLARYDVIAKDFLVYETSDAEALCALATTVAGALAHLGRAFKRSRGEPSSP
ncbi:hypothetical protein AKJ09_07293 [Labilithrix luteola]|uniref:Uncharacterized protein n=1 Tax=Labilithrix luteola TaxID=1391654 RepID=A0A0K1Q5F0_9BACT|nr:hypothetical protein [Labilithrix luteola]AKV00630.1 hypothetical protein AKJ09_07293 [Labilithrix luteola]